MLKLPPYDPNAPVVVMDIGNSTIALATWRNEQLLGPLSIPTSDAEAFDEAFAEQMRVSPKGGPAAVVAGSVVPAVLERVRQQVETKIDRKMLVVGETIPLPMDVAVTEPETLGVDRVCGAFAAYDTLQAPCIVVSFGTCVTIDLVDEEGVLLGGALLPGMRLQFQAMHEHTASLPEVGEGVPDLPFGRNTVEAMQTGVVRGIAGSVRGIVEGYAAHLNRWPQVLATGGDAAFFQPHCDFIDTFVSNLVLRGVGLAYSRHLAQHGA